MQRVRAPSTKKLRFGTFLIHSEMGLMSQLGEEIGRIIATMEQDFWFESEPDLLECQFQLGYSLNMTISTGQRSALTARGEATRERILAAAADLIYTQGVAATTIEDVREAAQASASQLYHYFDDKEALVRAVVQRQVDTVTARSQSAWADMDSVEGLRQWRDFVIARTIASGCRGGCRLGSLGGQLAEADPEIRAEIAAGFSRWETVIRSGLEQMSRRGVLVPEANPDDLAVAALAAMEGGMLLTQLHRDIRPLRVALDTMIDRIESLTVSV
jgi:TetR/AcrR family transcriptional regulator, transcriptional repressor for nem operon